MGHKERKRVRYAVSRFADSTQCPRGCRGFLGDLLNRNASHDTDGSGSTAAAADSLVRCLPSSWLLALLVAFLMASTTTSVAHADYGVIGEYRFQNDNINFPPDDPGEFGRLDAVGVNFTGSGGVAGDVYAKDAGNSFGSSASGGRIQQLSQSGAVKSIWGMDVVLKGPGNADEKQLLMVKATSGAYTLTFGGDTTDPIDFDASAATVKAELDALDSIGGVGGSVSVIGGPGDALGTTPYYVTFGGANSGANQPLLVDDSSSLSGGDASVEIAEVNGGGVGYEVCDPAAGDACKASVSGSFNVDHEVYVGGSLRNPTADIAVDQASGFVYSADFNRVTKFTSAGEFQRAFGYDTVFAGPNDSSNNEVQELTITATGGNFFLCYPSCLNLQEQHTGPIAYNATAQQIEDALESIPHLGGEDAELSISGSPGGPFTITFGGTFGGDDAQGIGTNGTNLTGPGAGISVSTTNNGGGPEICTVQDSCNGRAFETDIGGAIIAGQSSLWADLAVAPATAPNAGDVFVAERANNRVSEFTGDGDFVRAFGWDVDADDGTDVFEVCTAASGHTCQPGTSGASAGQFSSLSSIAVDSAGNIYTVEGPQDSSSTNHRVQKFTPQVGPPELLPSVFGVPGAPAGTADDNSPFGIGIGPSNQVYVAKNYTAGADSCADLSAAPAEVRVQLLAPDGLTLQDTSKACAKLPLELGSFSDAQTLEVDPGSGFAYLTHAGGVPGEIGDAQIYVLGEVGGPPVLSVDPPSAVTPTGATISGAITPNGPSVIPYPNPMYTTYHLEFKKTSEVSWHQFAPDVSVGGGNSPVPFNVGLSGLEPNNEYQARVVATKPRGFVAVVDTTAPFTTLGAPPLIEALSSSDVSASSAKLHAAINPRGKETTYHFEYGPTPAYGNSTPEVLVGDQLSPQSVEAQIANLEPIVYHFRVVATNIEGTSVSTDQTFNFYPEPCPNDTVRQQTGSGSLPDCRAYELVSPGDAGTALLNTGGPSPAHASSPARFAFLGFIGGIPGPWNIPTGFDYNQYVSTRGPTGWETNYVGFPADVTTEGTGAPFQAYQYPAVRPADLSLSHFLEWWNGRSLISPYVWNANGNSEGRWPSNQDQLALPDVSASEGGPVGTSFPAADFSHFFVASTNAVLAPGGLTTGAGSVYDNDISSETLSVASKLPGGGNIPAEPGAANEGRYLLIPGASTDGSHVLIAAPSSCDAATPPEARCPLGGSHLYMRVNGAVTYDVSQGSTVNFEGLTDDGSQVFFTSTEQLTSDDLDTSIDLFAWDEQNNEVTRVSAGAGVVGNTDVCNASWIDRCGIEVVPSDGGGEGINNIFTANSGFPSDNSVAGQDGAVYFYSPEQFVSSSGIPGRRNLYVARDGAIQYVASLDPAKPVKRIQVTPDGRYGAIITESKLTTYDNVGFDQMYVFDAVLGDLRCVSCDPSGEPPVGDVRGSDNGLFMSDDGRAFFTTNSPIVPADTNGGDDVYEYVNGRPRLITTGAEVDDPGRLTGLVGVTADGVDVYFATLATLVPEDENGRFIKFYDARTNGGFPVSASIAPCAAADECHDAEGAKGAEPGISSTAYLGRRGNVSDVSQCVMLRQSTRKRARQVKALRAKTARALQHQTATSRGKARVRRLKRKLRRFEKASAKARTRARRCRAVQRGAHADRRADK